MKTPVKTPAVRGSLINRFDRSFLEMENIIKINMIT